jgi:hypothetical protein
MVNKGSKLPKRKSPVKNRRSPRRKSPVKNRRSPRRKSPVKNRRSPRRKSPKRSLKGGEGYPVLYKILHNDKMKKYLEDIHIRFDGPPLKFQLDKFFKSYDDNALFEELQLININTQANETNEIIDPYLSKI